MILGSKQQSSFTWKLAVSLNGQLFHPQIRPAFLKNILTNIIIRKAEQDACDTFYEADLEHDVTHAYALLTYF